MQVDGVEVFVCILILKHYFVILGPHMWLLFLMSPFLHMNIWTSFILLSIHFFKYLYAGMPSFKRKESWFNSVSWCKYWGWFSWNSYAFCYMQNASWTHDLTKSPGFTRQFFCWNWHLLVSFSLQVDPFSSVSSAHDIGENVRRQIHKSHPTVTEMFIHIGLLDGFINFACDWDKILVICYESPPPI